MRRRHRRRITQLDIDFLCLAVFGMRSLPDAMAERIERRRLLADGLASAFTRHPNLGPDEPAAVEAVVA